MVTFNGYKESKLERYMYVVFKKKKRKKRKCVKRVSPILSYSYNALFGFIEEFAWDLLLRESVGIKCAKYDQHVKN